MRIAVAGNPNSGKTTLFNQVTGQRAKVANYPGVTVERKEAGVRLPSGRDAVFVDLPGCYSLTARSPEEEVAHHVLMGLWGGRAPEVVVCVIDATALARGLYLALQLCELDLPVVVALNMMDVATAQGLKIDIHRLEERLGRPVIPTCAREGIGLPALLAAIEATVDAGPRLDIRDYDLAEPERQHIEELRQRLGGKSLGTTLWLLSSEARLARGGVGPDVWPYVGATRDTLANAPEPFSRRLIAARYAYVDRLLQAVIDRSGERPHALTARLDRVLLHPILGLVTFFVAMFVLFQAVFAWAEPMMSGIEMGLGFVQAKLAAVIPLGLSRSLVVNGLLAGVGSVLVFLPQIALLFLGITLLEESGYLARAAVLVDKLMRKVGLHGKAFIPMMSGFACAVPAVMAARTIESRRDRLVTILVTPFMSCSARLPVYLLVTAAVLEPAPRIAGIVSVGGLATFAMYGLGFVAAIVTASLLKRTILRAPSPPFVLELPTYKMPLPREVVRRVYERCKVFVTSTGVVIVGLSMLLWALLSFPATSSSALDDERARIVATTPDGEAREVELLSLEQRTHAAQLEQSFAGRIGHAIEPLIAPLGFDWRIGIGLVASFAAREVLVSTLGQVYALGAEIEPDAPALRDALLADRDPVTGRPRFSPLVGISLMVFFVLAMQCLSTVATVKRETNSWGWAALQLVYMNALAYIASFAVYQGGRVLGF